MSVRREKPHLMCLFQRANRRISCNFVCVHVFSWTEVIKTAVDDLKKSGAPMRLSLPPGGGAGGAPFSPSP